MTSVCNPQYPITYNNPDLHSFDPGKFAALAPLPDLDAALPIVKAFLNQQWRSTVHQPVGCLKHPYLAPGATYHELWDNDSFCCSMGLPDEALEYAAGSLLNLLDNTTAEGRPPKLAQPDGRLDLTSHPIPLHGQFAWLVACRRGDFAWLEPYWPTLLAIDQWYEKNATRNGCYVWTSFQGPILDNNPAVYGRPPMTSCGIDLAAYHHRELLARAGIAEALNKKEAAQFIERAAAWREKVIDLYWDNLDQFFYNIDLNNDAACTTMQQPNWVTHLKHRSWASLYPLWGGLPTAEQAAAVRARVLDAREFLAPLGVRSHSALDRIYNNVPMGNPSNWQGPVWGLSTFLTSYGLARYGYIEDALEVAGRLVRAFAADITINGTIHETYHGDEPRPLTVPGFISWNMMAMRIIDDLRSGQDSTSYGLFDAAATERVHHV